MGPNVSNMVKNWSKSVQIGSTKIFKNITEDKKNKKINNKKKKNPNEVAMVLTSFFFTSLTFLFVCFLFKQCIFFVSLLQKEEIRTIRTITTKAQGSLLQLCKICFILIKFWSVPS